MISKGLICFPNWPDSSFFYTYFSFYKRLFVFRKLVIYFSNGRVLFSPCSFPFFTRIFFVTSVYFFRKLVIYFSKGRVFFRKLVFFQRLVIFLFLGLTIRIDVGVFRSESLFFPRQIKFLLDAINYFMEACTESASHQP